MPEEETAKQKLSGDICLSHNEYIVTVVIYLGFGSLLRKDCCSSLNKLCVTQV